MGRLNDSQIPCGVCRGFLDHPEPKAAKVLRPKTSRPRSKMAGTAKATELKGETHRAETLWIFP